MFPTPTGGIEAGNERKTAAGLESDDEKFQAGEREEGQPLNRWKGRILALSPSEMAIVCEVHNPECNTRVTNL